MGFQMTRRRRNSRRKNNHDILKYTLGSFLFVLVFSVVGGALYFKPDEISRDDETLCLETGPTAITTIIIDRTDNFSTISSSDVFSQIKDLLDASIKGEKLSVFAVDPIATSTLYPIFEVCNPGHISDANSLTSSKKIVARDWKIKFETPFEEILGKLLQKKEASISPIMESIQSVSITNLQSSKFNDLPKKIVLVSDLLQNSPSWSLYKNKPIYQDFLDTRTTRGLNPDLRNVSVEILFLQRETKRKIDESKLIKFWKRWIEEHGGRVSRILRVSGING